MRLFSRKYYLDNRERFPSGSYRGLSPCYFLYNIISKIEAYRGGNLLFLVPTSEAASRTQENLIGQCEGVDRSRSGDSIHPYDKADPQDLRNLVARCSCFFWFKHAGSSGSINPASTYWKQGELFSLVPIMGVISQGLGNPTPMFQSRADWRGLGTLIITSGSRDEPFSLVPILGVVSQGSRNPIVTYWSRLFTLGGLLTENPPPRYRRPTLSHYPPPLFSPGSTPGSLVLAASRLPDHSSHLAISSEDVPMATTGAQSNSPFTETSPANQREIRSPIPWEAGSPSRTTIVSPQLAVKIIRPGYRSNSLHQYVSAG